VGRIGVKETTAIGAHYLYRFLARDRSLRDQLFAAFESRYLGIGAEVLRHALPDEKQSRKLQHIVIRAKSRHKDNADMIDGLAWRGLNTMRIIDLRSETRSTRRAPPRPEKYQPDVRGPKPRGDFEA
jgi:hypothetical protein